MVKKSFKQYLIPVMIFILFCFTFAVSAQESVDQILKNSPSASDFPGEDSVIMLDQAHEELTGNDTVISTVKFRVKILSRQGKKDYGEIKIPFSSELEDIKINYIRTINPDGTVVKPDQDAIRVMTHPLAQGAPMYSDIKLKVISMPALNNGSIIDYSYTRTGETMMKGELFSSWFFQGQAPIMKSIYQVTVPQEKKLYWKTVNNNQIQPEETTDGDKKTYTWQAQDLEKVYDESSRPPLSRLSPGIYLSTLKDWSQMANWYQGLLQDRLTPDQDIKDKVAEITKGLSSRDEKIAHIFDYVATSIRYVALEFGIGKVQPHQVGETFHNKYGDCKDQASLLAAMLREAGIEAYVTLINGGRGQISYFDGPAHLGEFNHAITAVKKQDGSGYIFLDATCDVCNWQYLPDPDREKKVFVMDGKDGVIASTPDFDYKLNNVQSEIDATLDEKGNLQAKVQISPQGKWAYVYRALMGQYN